MHLVGNAGCNPDYPESKTVLECFWLKRVVDFLVEFEKNHLAAVTAALVMDPVEKWNVTDAVQKSEETNPEEKKKEDKNHSASAFSPSKMGVCCLSAIDCMSE